MTLLPPIGRFGRRWLFALIVTLLPMTALRAAEPISEQALRAALLFNFLKFTEWPAAEPNARLQTCIITGDPVLYAAMEALNERQIRGHLLTTLRYKPQAACDVIYVDSRPRWSGVADKLSGQAVLTIGGYKGFIADGGMIEVALDNDFSVSFEINQLEAKRSGLRLYPQLLRLARRVVE
jgi:hypothetical protein